MTSRYERSHLIELIHILRERGLTHAETAEKLGVSASQVSNVICDPDGSKQKARRERYRKPCPQCGTRMNGSGGHNSKPRLCHACARKSENNPLLVWTPDTIITRFQEFHQLTGRPPAVIDFAGKAPSVWPRLSPERQAEVLTNPVRLPHPSHLKKHFGGWREGVKAAGLTPAKNGRSVRRVTSTA